MKGINAILSPAIFTSILTFFLISSIGIYWTLLTSNSMIHQHYLSLKGLSQAQATILEKQLSSALTATQVLAYEIQHHRTGEEDSAHSKEENWFPEYSNTLLSSSSNSIYSLQIAPKGLIKQVFPMEKDRSLIGFNILSNSSHYTEIKDAIENKYPIALGPTNFTQADSSIIIYSPIFFTNKQGEETFWGLSSAVILLEDLLKSARLKQLEKEGYQYHLYRVSTDSHKLTTLASSVEPLNTHRATISLILPTGEWKLIISKPLDSTIKERQMTGYLLSSAIAFILSIFLYNILIQPQRLKSLVKSKTRDLEQLAYKDPLTGLPNRRHLQDTLPKILHDNHQNRRKSAFIYFDLDNFKRINDTIGHDVGDKVLIKIASQLSALQGENDLVIRLGGDEFGILINNIHTHEQIQKSAEQILKSINLPIRVDNQEFRLSTSLGIAIFPEHGYDIVSIMQNADMALYQAKESGKNQYRFYTEHMKIQTYNQIQSEYDLHNAIENNQFELYYQPQFDLQSNKIVAAEALIRWNHPEEGLVFPDNFIPLAEKTGQIIKLGYWVLDNAMAYIAQRKRENKTNILLHINLSSKQLSDPNLVPFVQNSIAKYEIPAKNIGFEITESLILEDIELAKNILQTFKSMGICISIDDFGTGYSSLAQLKNLPVSLLKIDRTFVTDLESDIDDRRIIEAIIAMAHKLNIKVLAEGIETRSQWKMLEEFKCDLGQGYYVSKPVKASDFDNIPSIQHND